ncbi:hypothetical protein I5L21_15195 [Serratia liquefaciens]|uniref:hypothetical protein n=1 Tax=Serratia liquefaciens TaxID=614 RepID=UPI0018D65D6A|nr:hypothetical protein [Serratia liquefaciens]MBH2811925.1 hypothetical protein [Serratia liquefaciens]
MRIDGRLNKEGLTARQLFFIECWSNFCHKNSLDTDRVTYSNALSAMQELLFLYGMEDKFHADKKRCRVIEELLDILEHDRCLNDEVFRGIPVQILSLCPRDILNDRTKSPVELRPRLMKSLCGQLISLISTYYVPHAFEHLAQQLFAADEMNDDDAQAIHGLTNSIMSVLLTQGMTLTECYLLYINLFRNGDRSGLGGFRAQFDSFRQKLITPLEDVTVRMYIVSEKLYALLSANGPALDFNNCHFQTLIDGRTRNTISVDILTQSMSDASARNGAGQMLRESLDVIAYMVGKGDITIQKQFVIIRGGNEIEVPRFDNEIEANADRLTAEEFTRFMMAMAGLFSGASDESRKKISSAFRFFRNGIENTSNESRFTSYWSALESLTFGVALGTPSHDEHVISVVAPCMMLDYIVKQLFALRQTLRYLQRGALSPVLVDNVNTLTLLDLYDLLKDPARTTELQESLQGYPYVRFSLSKLILLCRSPVEMERKLMRHHDKVTQHIYRLYLLRNTIVHNAGTSPHIDLLTVNLEHYLRGTINAMFYTASMNPTVNSPEEAFTRCQFISEGIFKELNPVWGITERKAKDKIEAGIKSGAITRSDSRLRDWLAAHN